MAAALRARRRLYKFPHGKSPSNKPRIDRLTSNCLHPKQLPPGQHSAASKEIPGSFQRKVWCACHISCNVTVSVVVRAWSRREVQVVLLSKVEAPRMKKFFRSEDGIAVTEYGLLIALVAIALIAVVTIFGSNISTWFAAKTGQITSV